MSFWKETAEIDRGESTPFSGFDFIAYDITQIDPDTIEVIGFNLATQKEVRQKFLRPGSLLEHTKSPIKYDALKEILDRGLADNEVVRFFMTPGDSTSNRITYATLSISEIEIDRSPIAINGTLEINDTEVHRFTQ